MPDRPAHPGTAFAEVDASLIHEHIRARVRAWTRGNNSGDAAVYERCERQAEKHQREAEIIAARYGCRLSWPGLYPVLETPARGTLLLGPRGADATAREFVMILRETPAPAPCSTAAPCPTCLELLGALERILDRFPVHHVTGDPDLSAARSIREKARDITPRPAQTVPLERLTAWVREAERTLAPGSESGLWGGYLENIRRLGHNALEESDEPRTIPASEAAWWVGAYSAALAAASPLDLETPPPTEPAADDWEALGALLCLPDREPIARTTSDAMEGGYDWQMTHELEERAARARD